MRASLPLTAISLVIALVPAAPAVAVVPPGRSPMPLAHTYSIVARDSVTGELGVAVQSHYFSVGPIVPWGYSTVVGFRARGRAVLAGLRVGM